jgi:hypothetical protein
MSLRSSCCLLSHPPLATCPTALSHPSAAHSETVLRETWLTPTSPHLNKPPPSITGMSQQSVHWSPERTTEEWAPLKSPKLSHRKLDVLPMAQTLQDVAQCPQTPLSPSSPLLHTAATLPSFVLPQKLSCHVPQHCPFTRMFSHRPCLAACDMALRAEFLGDISGRPSLTTLSSQVSLMSPTPKPFLGILQHFFSNSQHSLVHRTSSCYCGLVG